MLHFAENFAQGSRHNAKKVALAADQGWKYLPFVSELARRPTWRGRRHDGSAFSSHPRSFGLRIRDLELVFENALDAKCGRRSRDCSCQQR